MAASMKARRALRRAGQAQSQGITFLPSSQAANAAGATPTKAEFDSAMQLVRVNSDNLETLVNALEDAGVLHNEGIPG